MSGDGPLVETAADLIREMTPEQVSRLMMCIPGVRARVFKKSVRYIYNGPKVQKAEPVRRRREVVHNDSDIFKM